MPLYEFECEACKKRFERIQKFSDPTPDRCPHCGNGPIRKLLSSPAIQFKGSGFYITDYAKKSSSEAGSKSASGGEGGSSGTSESKSSESKSSDTKTESKSADSGSKSSDNKS